MSDLARREPIHDPQELERQLVARENAGDVDGMTALFEPDAVIELNDGRLVRGKEAIDGPPPNSKLRGWDRKDEGSGSGSSAQHLFAVIWPSPRRGSIDGDITSEVARRQDDGTWLWVIDRWSVNW